MKIALAADHAGYYLKETVKAYLRSEGHDVLDFGTDSDESVDYPDFVRSAAESVASGECEAGVVFGGSGNGEAIVANKVRGIRCAVCWNIRSAELAKEHNDANIVAIGARMVSPAEALAIIDAWSAAQFEGGRHQRRIAKIEE